MYKCSECGRPVGLFLDRDGNPRPYKCPYTDRLAEPQMPIRRKVPKMTQVAREDVLRQLKLEGHKVEG